MDNVPGFIEAKPIEQSPGHNHVPDFLVASSSLRTARIPLRTAADTLSSRRDKLATLSNCRFAGKGFERLPRVQQAFQLGLADTFDFEHFPAAGLPAHETHASPRHARQFR